MSTNYRDTLCLPKTTFPMKANLAQREPDRVKWWQENNIYERMVQKNADGEPYRFHDGPPYANGHIHHGHILNKVLKDIVLKYRNLAGNPCSFVPGWDCHGLPIEVAVEKKMGRKSARSMPVLELRQACRDYADKFVGIQRDEFMRLGVFADWHNPYLTTQKHYEATIVRELGSIYASGAVYRGKKPVHWCDTCQTALAEAEIEYENHKSPSIYVKFELEPGTYVVIWTTTPWTLPANLAIAFNPDFDYVWLTHGDETLIIAADMLNAVKEATGLDNLHETRREKGAWFEHKTCQHPFIDRTSLCILGDHVTLEAGTGCVHTAPGHGVDDAIVGARYGLELYTPVNDRGLYTSDFPLMEGQHVFKCNDAVCDLLTENSALLHRSTINHQYAHCWRSRNPIIYRATNQWFVAMDDEANIREKVTTAIDDVQWIPASSEQRIRGMVGGRPDWCISRQRRWGVPLTILYCDDCGSTVANEEIFNHVADLIEEHGSDVWYAREAKDLVPEGTTCGDCGSTDFNKEMDIVDVWFESGVSWSAVMGDIVDLYLEGSDQHRGWFQSTLLAGVPNYGRSPFKRCLTHGFVVDGKGKKLSKSLGNFIPPEKMLNRNGAEILRLWVCGTDYTEDIKLSNEILTTYTDAYRKIRNTFRFLVSNLGDFSPADDSVPLADRCVFDRHAWGMHQKRMQSLLDAYENFELHRVFQESFNYMNIDLSSFYLDVAKDRLYCEKQGGVLRRGTQTTLYEILMDLIAVLAPVLSFTCEELWEHTPKRPGDPESVFLLSLPTPKPELIDPVLEEDFEVLKTLRASVLTELEKLRSEKVIGHSLDATVTLGGEGNSDNEEVLERHSDLLADLFIVSKVEMAGGYGVKNVSPNDNGKCARCWKRQPQVIDADSICSRCESVV